MKYMYWAFGLDKNRIAVVFHSIVRMSIQSKKQSRKTDSVMLVISVFLKILQMVIIIVIVINQLVVIFIWLIK